MAVNKVVFGGETLVDLTQDTVSPQYLPYGETAHDKTGALIEGTAKRYRGSTTFTPGAYEQYIRQDFAQYGTRAVYFESGLTIAGDPNLNSSNIKKGVTIFGVTGTLESDSTGKITITNNLELPIAAGASEIQPGETVAIPIVTSFPYFIPITVNYVNFSDIDWEVQQIHFSFSSYDIDGERQAEWEEQTLLRVDYDNNMGFCCATFTSGWYDGATIVIGMGDTL